MCSNRKNCPTMEVSFLKESSFQIAWGTPLEISRPLTANRSARGPRVFALGSDALPPSPYLQFLQRSPQIGKEQTQYGRVKELILDLAKPCNDR